MVTAQRIITRALVVGLLGILTTTAAVGAEWSARYQLTHTTEVATAVVLLGLLGALLLGQLAIVPAVCRRARGRNVSRETSEPEAAAVFPTGHLGTPAAWPFSLSPVPTRSGAIPTGDRR